MMSVRGSTITTRAAPHRPLTRAISLPVSIAWLFRVNVDDDKCRLILSNRGLDILDTNGSFSLAYDKSPML